MIPDIINGAFELFGAVFQTMNVVALYRDKQVKGVRAIPTAFFLSWGVWNLYYYPYLNQIMSFIGGLALVITNFAWFFLMLYYKRREYENSDG